MEYDHYFNQLPKNEQVYHLFRSGKELFVRRSQNHIVKLFAYAGIWVEVWYLPERNIIENILVIDEKQMIELYENEINIGQLLDK